MSWIPLSASAIVKINSAANHLLSMMAAATARFQLASVQGTWCGTGKDSIVMGLQQQISASAHLLMKVVLAPLQTYTERITSVSVDATCSLMQEMIWPLHLQTVLPLTDLATHSTRMTARASSDTPALNSKMLQTLALVCQRPPRKVRSKVLHAHGALPVKSIQTCQLRIGQTTDNRRPSILISVHLPMDLSIR